MSETRDADQPSSLSSSQSAVLSASPASTNTVNGADADAQVRLSASAAVRINGIVADDPSTPLLRVSVEGGGCSGFQYKFELVKQSEPGDLIIVRDGATVLIDDISLPYLEGAEIDFVQELIGAAFKISNPNAATSCGCGTSFGI